MPSIPKIQAQSRYLLILLHISVKIRPTKKKVTRWTEHSIPNMPGKKKKAARSDRRSRRRSFGRIRGDGRTKQYEIDPRLSLKVPGLLGQLAGVWSVPGARSAISTEEKFARGSAQTCGPRGPGKLAGRNPPCQELSLIGESVDATGRWCPKTRR